VISEAKHGVVFLFVKPLFNCPVCEEVQREGADEVAGKEA